MIRRLLILAVVLTGLAPRAASAEPEVGSDQSNYEREIQAVVRDKRFYKAGKIELGITGGLTPYDSTYSNYLVGGRLTWHISDHYAWEIVDYQFPFSNVTAFTTSLVSSTTIANLQAVKLKNLVGTAFKLSPFYGKIRFWGSTVAFLDIYAVLGFGAVNGEVYQHSTGTPNGALLNAAWDPSLNYGLGFTFHLGNYFALNFDLRNYMPYTAIYGSKRFYSHFVFTGGLTLTLPGFG